MHRLIENHLEEALSQGGLPEGHPVRQHLNECDECRSEVDAMRVALKTIAGLRKGKLFGYDFSLLDDEEFGYQAENRKRVEQAKGSPVPTDIDVKEPEPQVDTTAIDASIRAAFAKKGITNPTDAQVAKARKKLLGQ